MRTFVRWYQTCLGIAHMTDGYGSLLNQISEFFQKIPVDNIIEIKKHEVSMNRYWSNIDEVFNKAIEIEAKLINTRTMSSHILPFTGRSQSIGGYHYYQETPRQPKQTRRRNVNYIETEIELTYILGKDLDNMNNVDINNAMI